MDKKMVEISRELQKCNQTNKDLTLPEIFGIQYKEIYITKWLEYLFNPVYNGLIPINALLKAAKFSKTIESQKGYNICTNYMFSSGRIIDILIETDKYLIGIENKIMSGEQYKQTCDYYNSLKEMSNGKELICIYLYPEINSTDKISGEDKFEKVLYTDFVKNLESDRKLFSRNSRQEMLLDEFISYVKEILMKKFCTLSEKAKFYASYSSEIDSAKNEYENFKEFIVEKLEQKAKEKGVLWSENTKNKLYQINCLKINNKFSFHFEIQLNDEMISNSELIALYGHLERSNNPKEEFDKVKKFFLEQAEEMGLTIPDNYTEDSNTCTFATYFFPVNFKSEEEADTMLDAVINKIEELNEWKEIADLCNSYFS